MKKVKQMKQNLKVKYKIKKINIVVMMNHYIKVLKINNKIKKSMKYCNSKSNNLMNIWNKLKIIMNNKYKNNK